MGVAITADEALASAMCRFWGNTHIRGACWEWQASLGGGGYGVFWVNGRLVRAHRFAYEMMCGRIPKGLVVMHTCDNRRCVRPAHLRVGTMKENTEDMLAKGRARTYGCAVRADRCIHGHAYTPENTYLDGRGGRRCRACAHARSVARAQREKAERARAR